jgi:hypothetical protein
VVVVEDGHQDEEGHPVMIGKATCQGECRVVLFPKDYRWEVQDKGCFILTGVTDFSLDRGIMRLLLMLLFSRVDC